MAETGRFSSLANEWAVHFKWFEAFIRGRCGASCCVRRVIPTKSTIRIELEQQTYADSNIVHEPATDSPARISGLQALIENAPPLPDRSITIAVSNGSLILRRCQCRGHVRRRRPPRRVDTALK